MTIADIALLRLRSQQITGTRCSTAQSLVAWMGAIQAQDYAMSKWAVGVRVPGVTDAMIEAALDRGEIFRTHVLRPTWHLVAREDIHWMLRLTARRIKSSMTGRHRALELSDAVFRKTNALLEKALSGGVHRTRQELVSAFVKAKIAVDANRSSHIFARAELDGIVCSGAVKNGKPTYALLAERAPHTDTLSKDEMLARLAKKYFSSHGPATLQDFTWWSGMTAGDARDALELIKPDLSSSAVGDETYWLPNLLPARTNGETSIHVLPAYDEFLISYKDRTASLHTKHQARAFSSNGIFWPVIVVNGRVRGLWKRTLQKERVLLAAELFEPLNRSERGHFEAAAEAYGQFLQKKVEVSYG